MSEGPQALSVEECLTLVIGSGPPGGGAVSVAREILGENGGASDVALFERVAASPYFDFLRIRGLGMAQKTRLMAVFELCRRYASFRIEETARTLEGSGSLSSQVIGQIPGKFRTHPQEWLGFVPVFGGHKVGQFVLIEKGARTHVNIDPMELFARILSYRPQGFFLVHNHPSGDCTPSEEDYDLTFRSKDVADQLGLKLFGHLIVSSSSANWVHLC